MKSCKTCGKDTDELYKHHIIPIANGGKDKKENIIDICVDCHSIAHDVSFKSSKGPIRNGIKKTKDAHAYFCNLDDNFWLGFFDDLNFENNYLYCFIWGGFMCGEISGSDLIRMLEDNFKKRKNIINISDKTIRDIKSIYEYRKEVDAFKDKLKQEKSKKNYPSNRVSKVDNKKIKELLDQGLNKAEVARTLNISRMTVYRAINIKDNSDG